MPRDQSPVLPGTVRVFFAPYPCGTTISWSDLPTLFSLDATLAAADLGDAVGSPEIHSVRDSAHAIYVAPGGGDPTNKAALQTLANRIALDFWSWRLVAYDRNYNGVIVPAIDATVDAITWRYREDDCSTRMVSTPIGGEPALLWHDDPLDDCDGRLKLYGGPKHATLAGGVLTLPVIKPYIEGGILKWVVFTPDTLTVCSTGS